MYKRQIDTLKKHGGKAENILVKTVPGSFELTFGANQLIEYSEVDAVIAIGCVVRGDTPVSYTHLDVYKRQAPN